MMEIFLSINYLLLMAACFHWHRLKAQTEATWRETFVKHRSIWMPIKNNLQLNLELHLQQTVRPRTTSSTKSNMPAWTVQTASVKDQSTNAKWSATKHLRMAHALVTRLMKKIAVRLIVDHPVRKKNKVLTRECTVRIFLTKISTHLEETRHSNVKTYNLPSFSRLTLSHLLFLRIILHWRLSTSIIMSIRSRNRKVSGSSKHTTLYRLIQINNTKNLEA